MPTFMRAFFKRFREDMRKPLPGTAGVPRHKRYGIRLRYLASIYGWKFVVGFIAFYLVRDVILYILLPWFVAKKLLFD
jgi:hypothetical protein